MLEFRLLGPVELWVGAQRVEVGQPRQRAVLAVLAAAAGRTVGTDALIDRVWGETPPATARRSLHAHVTRVRRVLEDAGGQVRLARRSGGYLLDTDPGVVDLHRMRALLERSRLDGDDGKRAGLLREAVTLWRGEPLTGIDGPWAERMRQSWSQEHLDLVVAWSRAERATGRPGAVLGRLAELAQEHPLAEPLGAELIRALHAAGRSAEALDRYAGIRERLGEQLGVDPGAELQSLHKAILQSSAETPVTPAQLPADAAGFAGRTEPLARLDDLLAGADATVLAAISGTAGVGKTSLAVRWAHSVAGRFPDGLLYVNLRGFDPGGRMVDAGEALRGFLTALGVAPERVPRSGDEQIGLYRSLLAGKRVLVLLDNARDADHVRTLLPVSRTALAIVTSRNHLLPLAATHGAHVLSLDAMDEAEARELLVRRLGAERIAAEPDAAARIVTACAGLPLALAIVAARAWHSRFPLSTLAAELSVSETGRLAVLDAGDTSTRIETVFSWSYAALGESAARLFRLLSTHPGPDLTVPAAASLAGSPIDQVRRDLAELARASMLVEHSPGRYSFHDLLRAYAAGLAAATDGDRQRHTATARLLDHYLQTAQAATMLLDPAQEQLDLGAPLPGVVLDPPAKYQEALDWFAAERRLLLASVRHAADAGFDAVCWQLTRTLVTFLDWQGHWHDLEAAARHAVAAADRSAAATDENAAATARRHLSVAYLGLHRLDEAEAELRAALALSGRTGDLVGQAFAHNSLAAIEDRRDAPGLALPHARRALELYEAAGHRVGQAVALSSVGWYQALLGDYPASLVSSRRALDLLEELGDRYGQAHAWDTLGYARHRLGRPGEAVEPYRNAVAIFAELGDRYQEADTTDKLGDALRDDGDPGAAREAWQHAWRILTELRHPAAAAVGAKLHDRNGDGGKHHGLAG